MNRLVLILMCLVCSPFSSYSDDTTDTTVKVENIAVEGNESDLEYSKYKALDYGKTEAFRRLAKKIYENADEDIDNVISKISTKDIDDCIDDYTIKEEKFINTTYRAIVTYRLGAEKVKDVLNRINYKNKAGDLYKNLNNTLEDSKIICITSSDIVKTYKFLKNLTDFSLYSISNNTIKLRYSKQLDRMLQKTHLKMNYEKTD